MKIGLLLKNYLNSRKIKNIISINKRYNQNIQERSKRMIKIKKFKAYVPPKELVCDVICPPYDVLNTQEAREMAEKECSFLHVNKCEIEFPDDVDMYTDPVYERARDNLCKFVEKGWLVKDDSARLYIYAQKMWEHTQYGIVALSSVEDYAADRIKKHELTRKKKEVDRTKITDIQNANIGPVFLTYPNNEAIDLKVKDIVLNQEPYSKVLCDDQVEHTLWLLDQESSDYLVAQFAELPATYVADGHHRAASAFNVGKMRRDKAIADGKEITGEEDFNFFLTLLYAADNLMILDYNRVIKTLGDMTTDQFIEKVAEKYEIEEIKEDPKPKEKGTHAMYINGKWFSTKIKPGLVNHDDPVKSLDVQVLTDNVLGPILNVEDVRTDERLDFIGGIRGLKELERRCSTDCVVAFAMYPVSMEEIMKIADNHLLMPPKSTWFEPKPRSGMVVRCFEQE